MAGESEAPEVCHNRPPRGRKRRERMLDFISPARGFVSPTTLAFPRLLDAPGETRRALFESSNVLSRLLACVASAESRNLDFWGWLCGELGIARQDDWPLAPIWAESDGLPTAGEYWLVASPVTLEVGRDDVRLAEVDPTADAVESALLLATLNNHFDTDGLTFVRAESGRWFAHRRERARIVTTPPDAARGRSLRPFLPQGPEAGKWRRWQNEIQMLLHEHTVNGARLARGAAAINSVWLWAGGTLPVEGTAPALTFFTKRADCAAIARHAGASVQPLQDVGARTGEKRLVLLDEEGFAAPAPNSLAGRWAAAMPADTDLVLGGSVRTVVLHARRPSLAQRLSARLRSPDVGNLLLKHGVLEAHEV